MTGGVILCADDEPTNLLVMRQILQKHYQLLLANDGAQVLATAEKSHPDLILMDVDMPELDGFEVARRLTKTMGAMTPLIIFVTGRKNQSDEEKGFAVGCVDYLTKPFSPNILRARVRAHLALVRADALERSRRDAIEMLGLAGHYNDSDTGSHIWRMASYARLLAEAAGWPQSRSRLLELAAAMHDTGKIGTPRSILSKPGPLSPDEWATMRAHTIIGHRILSRSQAPVFQLAAEIALRHHEHWDGSGYPDGLAGIDIPESARIVAVADVFDALTSRRSYKEPWPTDQVVETLSGSAGTHLDPRLVEIFIAILPQILAAKDHWNGKDAERVTIVDR